MLSLTSLEKVHDWFVMSAMDTGIESGVYSHILGIPDVDGTIVRNQAKWSQGFCKCLCLGKQGSDSRQCPKC